MHEAVDSSSLIRRLKSLPRPSFAGNGLAERMRSTAFAFLGLTAALGLALVAIFAHLSFSVLAPAPPPAGPAGESGVSTSLALGRDPGAAGPRASFLSGAEPAGGTGGTIASAERDKASIGGIESSGAVGLSGNGAGSGDDEPAEPSPTAPASAPPGGEEAASVEGAPAPVANPIPTSPNPGPVTSTPKPPGEPEPTPAPTDPEAEPGEPSEGCPEEESEDDDAPGWDGDSHGRGNGHGHHR